MDTNSRREKITIICEKDTKTPLERFLRFLRRDEYEFQTFEKEKDETLKDVVLGRYYISAVLVLPYSPEILKELLGIGDFIIFSQRLSRHHIFFYQWCKEENLGKLLQDLRSALKYKL